MLKDIIYLLFFALTILSGIGAVSFRRVLYNALSLGLCFFGIAGIYIFLNAEFLAALQIIVYIGAIAIAIVFAIMMSDPVQKPEAAHKKRSLLALAFSLTFAGVLGAALLKAPWPASGIQEPATLEALGALLLSKYVLPFEIVSLILLVAIIGAFVITRGDSGKNSA